MKQIKVIDFEEYFNKWFEVKKKRYNTIKMKYGYSIYDLLRYDMIKDNDGDFLMFEEEREAKDVKNKMNSEWEVRLKEIYERRKEETDIWAPMFLIDEDINYEKIKTKD